MHVLVDEGMPVQVVPPLRLNRGHVFDHVEDLGWKGTKDVLLFHDAAAKGYEAILTLDVSQLDSVDESRAPPSGTPSTTPRSPESDSRTGAEPATVRHDLRGGGRLTADGVAIQEDGKFA